MRPGRARAPARADALVTTSTSHPLEVNLRTELENSRGLSGNHLAERRTIDVGDCAAGVVGGLIGARGYRARVIQKTEAGYKKAYSLSQRGTVLCGLQPPVARPRPPGPCLATRAGFIVLGGLG